MKVAKTVKLLKIDAALTVARLPWVGSADGLKAHIFKDAAASTGFQKLPAIFVFMPRHER
ncbi:hypothetical protein [Dyadobacter koreensis]|uniref:hypothetical protein n=1 Tax=Dyadobacter koreensis TaxID=408657 RepID=UPI000B827E3A|nr:hypothetical protein [Dyadobacter koreensis]